MCYRRWTQRSYQSFISPVFSDVESKILLWLFSETGKRDGAETIAKLKFLPWQTKVHCEALIEANRNVILGAAAAATVFTSQSQDVA